MSVITLITDWQRNDHYLGAIKGKLFSLKPEVHLVEITHQIQAFDYLRAAFILKNSYKAYPSGTVHIVGVNSEASAKTPHIAVKNQGQYFIGADNGILGIVFNGTAEKIVHLDHSSQTSFPEFDVFIDAAVYLSGGGDINLLGAEKQNLYLPMALRPPIENNQILGGVLYIDSFSNVITNVSREFFESECKGRRFEIFVNSNHYKISKINTFYHETAEGELLALFNSVGLLEIAINKGFAAELLNLGMSSVIRIKFFDQEQRELLRLV